MGYFSAAIVKAVNACKEYMLNNWDGAVPRMQDKNVYGCSAEGYVSHVYSDRMNSSPMGWSETGADAMCRLRCYVRDYREEKVIDLVHYRRGHKEEKLPVVKKEKRNLPGVSEKTALWSA